MRLTREDADLVRWLYVVAGLSRARLARDFECSTAEIEEVVSTGLGQMLNPASRATGGKPRQMEFQAGALPQVETPMIDREQLFESFRRALTDF